jgi:hypothetical protein
MMNNERMPKKLATAKMDGIGEKGRLVKRWNNEVEENLKTMGIRNWRRVARNREECRRIVLDVKVHMGCSA